MFCRNIKYFKITDKQTTREMDIYITGILMKKREKRKQKKMNNYLRRSQK